MPRIQIRFAVATVTLAMAILSTAVNQATASVTLSQVTTSGYAVDVFECDRSLNELSRENRQKKKMGTTYNICFRPNQAALDAGVSIHRVDHWTWDTTYDGGEAVMKAISDGQGDGVLSDIRCKNEGKICHLTTMLPANFFLNPGTVTGEGKATFSGGNGSVFVRKDLFQGEFSFKLTMPDGSQLNADEAQKYIESLQEDESEKGDEAVEASDKSSPSTEL